MIVSPRGLSSTIETNTDRLSFPRGASERINHSLLLAFFGYLHVIAPVVTIAGPAVLVAGHRIPYPRRNLAMIANPHSTFRTLALALMLLLPAAVLAAEDEPAQMKVELKKGDKIIFFGDSLTEMSGQ